MGLFGNNDLDYLEGFQYERDRRLTRSVADTLSTAGWSEELAINRMRFTLHPEDHLINVWYSEADYAALQGGLWKEVNRAIGNSLGCHPKGWKEWETDREKDWEEDWEEDWKLDWELDWEENWEEDWEVVWSPVCDFADMVFTGGVRYSDPLNREMPPAEDTWYGLSKYMDLSSWDVHATSVAWLAYARLLVTGPFAVIDWIDAHLLDVRARLAEMIGSQDAIITFGFQAMHECPQSFWSVADDEFSSVDRQLISECQTHFVLPEKVIYTPHHAVAAVERNLAQIRAHLCEPVTVVPVPFAPVPPEFLAIPFHRRKAYTLSVL